MAADACKNCRRPIHWLPGVGWLHDELPQYADQPITCTNAIPVCEYWACDHSELPYGADGPDGACGCRCHRAEVSR